MGRRFKTGRSDRMNYIYFGVDGTKTVVCPGREGITEDIINAIHEFEDEEYNL